MILNLNQNTDPIRDRHWWTKERFFLSPKQPSLWLRLTLWRLRLLWWGPEPFLSITWGNRHQTDGQGHFHAWQVYLGWKCDATRTAALRYGAFGGTPEEQQGYVMVDTIAEFAAVRRRWVDLDPSWTNQGGA